MALVYDFFLHNWNVQVTMTTTWTTDVQQSPDNLAEQRHSLLGSPRRALEVVWAGLNKTDSARLMFLLMRAGDQELRVPLYQDVAAVTASSSGTTINCETEGRRFFVGQLVAIVAAGEGNAPGAIEYQTLLTVGSGVLTTTAALGQTYDVGARVYPVIITERLLNVGTVVLTDHLQDVVAIFQERTPSLPAQEDWATLVGTQIDGFAYLFESEVDWSRTVAIGVARRATPTQHVRDLTIITQGPRALLGVQFGVTTFTRAEFDQALKFFDAHRGRAIPFWVRLPLTLWTPVGKTASYLDVEAAGDLDDYSMVVGAANGSPYLMLELANGTTELRQVSSVIDVSGNFRITVVGSLAGILLADITRASLALFVRFDKDAFVETWATNEICRMDFEMVEVLSSDELVYIDEGEFTP